MKGDRSECCSGKNRTSTVALGWVIVGLFGWKLDGRAHDHVQCLVLATAVLNMQVLLP
jgi:hypothetical protein